MKYKYDISRKVFVFMLVVAVMIVASIPIKAQAATVHTVVKGDTLWKISQRYGTTVNEIKRANNYWKDEIYPGQKLVITWPSTASSRGSSTYNTSFSSKDIELMAKMVHGESRGEPFEGQVAVAAVILNRVRDSRFPNTVSGVIYEPGAFTALQDGQFYLTPNATAYKAVDQAIKGWDASGGALFYFNPATATSKWVWTRQIIKKIGKHYFAK
ncbi:MAG: Spore cortex-lytic enzyme, lytic transglycosylase SleB [Firmicutes bacterium]|nr:Spore cortex-lytic enzyme, lytic transglycosylase SleB [Bacillota bacterium]MDI6706513.1 cell wall hydrolase [Bacillota bacterium]